LRPPEIPPHLLNNGMASAPTVRTTLTLAVNFFLDLSTFLTQYSNDYIIIAGDLNLVPYSFATISSMFLYTVMNQTQKFQQERRADASTIFSLPKLSHITPYGAEPSILITWWILTTADSTST
jgi:hypothetical protein